MALRDTEGFGLSTNAADYLTYGLFYTGFNSIGTNGPLGDNYATVFQGQSPYKQLASAYTTFFFGARMNNNLASPVGLGFNDVNGVNQIQVNLNVSSNGSVEALRNGTLLGSSAVGVVPIDNWYYVEVGAVIAAGTGGSVTVKINGVQVLALTGINTAGGGNNNVQRYGVVHSQFDDLLPYTMHWYFCDNTGPAPWNTFLGDTRIQTINPTSNANVQFTPEGQASNYENVSLVPPVPGTDFNQSGTVGAQDTFNVGSMDATLTTVFGVKQVVLAAKSDAGSRSLETVLQSGTTTATGTSTTLGTGAQVQVTMYETDPNTNAQWTQSGVNAAKPGYNVSG